MPRIKGSVRRSQLITTYGVGAVIAVDEESFMVAGIDRWPVTDAHIVHEPRLERELNVGGFRVPPATEHGSDVPVVRFPGIYSCSGCNRIDEFKWLAGGPTAECNNCGRALVPSRFVTCCANGHIDEFPYFRWLHKGQEATGAKKHRIEITAAGKTASLRDIELSCDCGVESVNLDGAFGKFALKEFGPCSGRRPWLPGAPESCNEVPRVLQRGASNVWYPVVRSALSIPPWSEGAYKAINRWWHVLQHVPEAALRPTIEGMGIVADSGYTLDDLVLAVSQRKQGEAGDGGPGASLKEQEYEALCKGKPDLSRTQDFVCVPAEGDLDDVTRWFAQVMLVKRLREVRVLEAFTRVLPLTPGDSPSRRARVHDAHPGWLPALEVTGEGVFLRLDPKRLYDWERAPAVVQRVMAIATNYRNRFTNSAPDRPITPRLIMVHTLAHALINQWSLDSGYPAASLRERLYVSDSMAGLMIYTATTDSAGSLGGVVGQAEPHRLGPALIEAIHTAAWCSSDPLCIESRASGVDALNLAACHACVLLPETSCEEMNLLLDRGLLVGTPTAPAVGFFAELLA